MLVLSRKPNQQIAIGDSITLTVVAVQGGRVRLGIDAPRSVRVLRSELEQRVTNVVSAAFEPLYCSEVDLCTSRDR